MNPILVGLVVYVLWRVLFRRQADALDAYLDEHLDLQRLGLITTRGTIAAKNTVPLTREEPGPLNGAVVVPGAGGNPIPSYPWPEDTLVAPRYAPQRPPTVIPNVWPGGGSLPIILYSSPPN